MLGTSGTLNNPDIFDEQATKDDMWRACTPVDHIGDCSFDPEVIFEAGKYIGRIVTGGNLTLKAGETYAILGLPSGTQYTITEKITQTTAGGYDCTTSIEVSGEDAGAQTELIQLSDLTFSGCRSCFACKKAGSETGRCMWKDDLQPVLDKILSADAVFMGSPIYLGNVSGMMYCLMERLVFSLLSYDDYSKKLFHGKVNACFFFTMNAPEEFASTGYRAMMQQYANAMKRLGGSSEYYAACDTLQFDDYSRYAAGSFNENHKRKMRDTQYPKDLRAEYDIGFKLIHA